MKWQKTPILNSKNTIVSMPSEYEVKAENVDLKKFYKSFENDSDRIKIKDDNLFYKFEIVITKTDTTIASKLNAEIVEILLKKADLVH